MLLLSDTKLHVASRRLSCIITLKTIKTVVHFCLLYEFALNTHEITRSGFPFQNATKTMVAGGPEVTGHFGPKILRHQDISALVPNCLTDILALVPKCPRDSSVIVLL